MEASYPANYLERLPTELFPIIIENIGLDLIAHVSFSKLIPRIGLCYEGRGKGFWEPICRASGLEGSKYALELDASWEGFAFKCVEHALSCSHPACGITRLRENAKLMQRYIAADRDITSFPGLDDDHHHESNPVYKHIVFKHTDLITESDNTPYLRLNANDRQLWEPLQSHPIVWQSFAVFPPAAKLNMMSLPDFPPPSNDSGVSVGDLVSNMMDYFKNPADNIVFSELLDSIGARKIFPSTWSPSDMFRTLRSTADWFRIVHWVGIEHQETVEGYGPFFLWRFQPRALPASPWDLYRESIFHG